MIYQPRIEQSDWSKVTSHGTTKSTLATLADINLHLEFLGKNDQHMIHKTQLYHVFNFERACSTGLAVCKYLDLSCAHARHKT